MLGISEIQEALFKEPSHVIILLPMFASISGLLLPSLL
jgi:hypothetical protein